MPKLPMLLLKRLRKNYQLSIITLMGLFGIMAVTPYAVYRLVQGNYLVGVADTIIVLSTIVAVLHAWRSGDTVKPGLCLAVIFSAGATVIAINLGVNGLFWIYPLILFNFFMVSPGKAIVVMLMVLVSLLGHALLIPGSVFESSYQMISFLVTGLIASLFTYIFAYRTNTQRDQLQAMAILDPLTGARNRRAMNDELRIAVSTHRRHGSSYGVLVMDLDHFKQINDRFGHPAGDQVLMDFVELIQQCSRQENRLFRFGGEEFLLLVPNTDEAGLQADAAHLQNQVREHLRGPGGPVTMSVGGAILRTGESWEAWLQRADQHLYEAKNAGRNCSIIEPAPAPQPA
jgi:diguanylate cyclase